MRNMYTFLIALSVAAIFGCGKPAPADIPPEPVKEVASIAPVKTLQSEAAEIARILVGKHMKFPSSVVVQGVVVYDYKAGQLSFCGEQSSVNGLGNRLPMRPFYIVTEKKVGGNGWEISLAVFDDNSLVETMCDTDAFLQKGLGSAKENKAL